MTKDEVLLNDLIVQAEKYLWGLNYSRYTIKTYRLIWRHFRDYAETECQLDYSREIANRFLNHNYGISDPQAPKTPVDRTRIRAMNILDAIKHTDDIQKIYKSELRIRPHDFEEIYKVYQFFLISQNYSKNTIATRLSRIDVFFRYLEDQNILHLEGISPQIILEFLTFLQKNYSSAGRSNVLFTLRAFLSCPSLSTHLPASLSKVIPVIRTNKQERLPSFYSPEEVKRILGAVDRSSPQGKKDYLMILLAAQLGIRASDIRRLKLDDIKWESLTIEFAQQKTRQYLQLPIPESLKFALLDYLKNGRAHAACGGTDYLFIRSRAPYEPYADNNHLTGRIALYFQKSGVQIQGKHHGLHSLRHSLASLLLKNSTPITSIAQTLGHKSIEATKRYLQIDIEQLRRIALEVPGHE
jgi:integrase